MDYFQAFDQYDWICQLEQSEDRSSFSVPILLLRQGFKLFI